MVIRQKAFIFLRNSIAAEACLQIQVMEIGFLFFKQCCQDGIEQNIDIKYLFHFEEYLHVLETFHASCLSAFNCRAGIIMDGLR